MLIDEDLKAKYKSYSPDELARYGLLSPANTSGWNCPYCGNGTGENGTGVKMNLLSGGYVGHCFRCNESFDVFNLIAEREHLDCKTQFKEVLEVAKGIFEGDTQPRYNAPPKVKYIAPVVEQAADSKEIEEMIRADIAESQKNLPSFIKSQGGSYRGLTLETLQKFSCGYLPHWTHPKSRLENKSASPSRRLIIPAGAHYNAVMLNEDRTPQNQKYWKMHAGKIKPFGFNQISASAEWLRIVEGEIDAMSCWQALKAKGLSEKYSVIATCGAGQRNFIDTLIEKYPARNIKLLIKFDSDEAGMKNAYELRKILIAQSFHTAIKFISEKGSKIDDNDILTGKGELQHE